MSDPSQAGATLSLREALTIAARALRAGHPFSDSLRLVSEEMADPVATEFGMVFNQINYGGSMYYGGDLADCIRISVGSREENERMLEALRTLTETA